jgi:nucleoid-associated protein EbfC
MDWKGGLGDLVQQASKLREEFKRVQETMASKSVEASTGGGMVKVTVNGRQQVLRVQIDPQLIKMNDQEILQDLVKAGVNEALKASQDLVSEEMGKVAGGLGPLASMLKGFS